VPAAPPHASLLLLLSQDRNGPHSLPGGSGPGCPGSSRICPGWGKPDLSDFRRLVAAADIGVTQSPKDARLTIFALTNAALALRYTAPNTIDKAIADAATDPSGAKQRQLDGFVRSLITNTGAFTTKTLTNGQTLTNVNGLTLTANMATTTGRPVITITEVGGPGDKVVVKPNNIRACNSFIHAVNIVNIPTPTPVAAQLA
jgi:hypothetical protein